MRISLVFAGGTAADAFLTEAGHAAPAGAYSATFAPAPGGHQPGCACCRPGSAAATALAKLYLARVTGAAPWFTQVVVRASPAGEAAVREAMEEVIVAARYRIS